MRYLFIFMLTTVFLLGQTIRFSPLPMDKAPQIFLQYSSVLKYLEEETGHKFKLVYSSSYEEIIENFKLGNLDIIELGPLPFVKLKKNYAEAEAFLTFKSKNGKASYTCDILTSDKDLNSLYDLFDQNLDKKILLTRKLSTCGYLMTEFMFEQYNQTLDNTPYSYIGTHSDVLLELLLTKDSIGTVKSTVSNKYEHLKLKKLAQSPAIPGFAFIANKKTISNSTIKSIQEAILKLEPLKNSKDKEIVSSWSLNTKYGAIKTKVGTYDIVEKAYEKFLLKRDNVK